MNRSSKSIVATVALLVHLSRVAGAVQAHADLDQTNTNFSYTLHNDEPSGSTLLLSAFHLATSAPFEVVSAPAGWAFETDNHTYVDWFATNSSPPFSNNIPPGGSLAGFVLQSQSPASETLGYSLLPWDSATNACGPALLASIGAPSVTNLAPTLVTVTNAGPAGFEFAIQDFPSFSYVIETSTNLTDWVPVFTNAAPFIFADTNLLQNPLLFYRSMFLPDPSSMNILGD